MSLIEIVAIKLLFIVMISCDQSLISTAINKTVEF